MNLFKISTVIIAILFFSCENKKSNNDLPKNEASESQELNEQIIPLDKTGIFSYDLLVKNNKIELNNIEFLGEGAKFSSEQNSFIEIPIDSLDIEEELGINMVFSFTGQNGALPQTLISLVDEFNEIGSSGFSFYISDRRITGVFKGNFLWGKNYSYKDGMSGLFFDTPQLQIGKFYTLSVNINNSKVEFYVNGEKYQEFDNIQVKDFKGEKIILGAFKKSKDKVPSRNLDGTIRFLELYKRNLMIDEVLEFFLLNRDDLISQNDIIDIQKMEEN